MLFSIKPGIIWKKQKKAKKRHFERANFGSSNNGCDASFQKFNYSSSLFSTWSSDTLHLVVNIVFQHLKFIIQKQHSLKVQLVSISPIFSSSSLHNNLENQCDHTTLYKHNQLALVLFLLFFKSKSKSKSKIQNPKVKQH